MPDFLKQTIPARRPGSPFAVPSSTAVQPQIKSTEDFFAAQGGLPQQQLARSGLTGSGIAADVLGNADLAQADALRKARFGLINQRIRALLGIAETPQQEGFIQSGLRAFSAASSSAATAAAGGG